MVRGSLLSHRSTQQRVLTFAALYIEFRDILPYILNGILKAKVLLGICQSRSQQRRPNSICSVDAARHRKGA
jgi:hypothetical protein